MTDLGHKGELRDRMDDVLHDFPQGTIPFPRTEASEKLSICS